MFILSKIEHTLRFDPSLLDLPLAELIKAELERLFLDKIIANLGLVISVYDIQSIVSDFILPGDGFPKYTVNFRLIMFRPFIGEVISAKLLESTADGLVLSIGFFDDIKIPRALLPSPSVSKPDPANPNRVHWSWKFGGKLYPIDGVDEIKFKVYDLRFPPLPLEQGKDDKPFAPMVVIGSLDAVGLGPSSWLWGPKDATEEEGEEEDEDGPCDAPVAMATNPPHLHNDFGSRADRTHQAKQFMDTYGSSDRSLAITWLAIHGNDSICVVTMDKHLKCLENRLVKSKDKPTAERFIPSFWNAIVSNVEGLNENMVQKIPFHAVFIYQKGGQPECSAVMANRLLRRELQEKSNKNFDYHQTLKSTVLCSRRLFRKGLEAQELEAHEMRVFAWKLNENTGAELDHKHVKDLLAEIEDDFQKNKEKMRLISTR